MAEYTRVCTCVYVHAITIYLICVYMCIKFYPLLCALTVKTINNWCVLLKNTLNMPCVCFVYLEFMFEKLYLCVVKLLRTYKNSYYSMNKEFWIEGSLGSLIYRTYSIAEEHGFHENDLSIPHMMMLVLTEISEAVDADRKNLHADIESYYDEVKYGADVYDRDLRSPFEKYVKSSLEDELGDVCIRIFDACGELGIMPNIPKSEDYMSIWREMFAEESFCELMYELSCLVTEAHEDSSSEELSDITGAALLFVACLCEHKGIDLERHIELKMDYNEHRPYLNGKKY